MEMVWLTHQIFISGNMYKLQRKKPARQFMQRMGHVCFYLPNFVP